MPVWTPILVAALAVLLIYLIRPSASTLSVASTLLWRRLLATRKRRDDRLRWLLSLLLAMTVASFLALATGQARWLQPGGGDRIALVIDPSPTLRARLPGGGSRLELARAEARRIVTEAPSGSRFTLGEDPAQLTPSEALLALSGEYEPAGGSSPAIPAADTVYLFSDGVAPWRPIVDPGASLHTVSVLAPARNAGIVRFSTRPPPTRERGTEALIEIVATDAPGRTDPVAVELIIEDEDALRVRRQLTITPGRSYAALIDISTFSTGPVEARISVAGDALEADDRAGLVHARESPWRALVGARSRGSFADSATARALEANPRVDVIALIAASDDADGGDDTPSEAPTAADFVVFHQAAPLVPPALPGLYLDLPAEASAGGVSAATGPEAQRPIHRVDSEHPLLDGVSLFGVPVAASSRQVDPRCSPVAEAGDRPVIVVCDPSDPEGPIATGSAALTEAPRLPDLPARSVVVAFDLDRSPLAQRPDAAAFIQNATEWLNAGATAGGSMLPGLQDERATRMNDSGLDAATTGRLDALRRDRRRSWSWQAFAILGLLLASFEAFAFFRGLTV